MTALMQSQEPSDMSFNHPAEGHVSEVTTDRLALELITDDDVQAVLQGPRSTSWAADFPADGDRVIARLLARIGAPTGPDAIFGHRLVRERDSGLVVGGLGFFGPPEQGKVELGYGIVGSRQRRGYATEAVLAMIELALVQPGVDEVVAVVDPHNEASVRVLEKSGMSYESAREAGHRYTSPGRR